MAWEAKVTQEVARLSGECISNFFSVALRAYIVHAARSSGVRGAFAGGRMFSHVLELHLPPAPRQIKMRPKATCN